MNLPGPDDTLASIALNIDPSQSYAQPGWGRDLEWEVTHKKSKVHKGRGNTPEAALRDLRDGFAKGVKFAQEEIDREQKRLDHLNDLLSDTAPEAKES